MVPRETGAHPAVMEAYFHELANALEGMVHAGETGLAWLAAESTDFVRMNRGKVRQPGSVVQRYLDVSLISGARQATRQLSLSGELVADRERVAAAIGEIRSTLPDLADDPHLLVSTVPQSTRTVRGGPLADAEEIVATVLSDADGLDLVGLYAGGPVYRGFANSLGQRNWHEATAFNLQWSLYHRTDKAVKSGLSGFTWDALAFAAKMGEARAQLADIARPPKTLAPGKYRVFLAPSAFEDVASMLCWGGFSARALATKQSSLTRMRGDDAEGLAFDPRITMTEATVDGVAPGFQSEGFARPARVPLIEAGRLVGALCSPRTAREFSLEQNGANGHEGPESLTMKGGTLAAADALSALGTGIYAGNLHYLNYSDRPAGRMTGMTRFATFWVENGRIVAPIDVMRFDDTIFRMLGANLEALTAETELLLASDSYHERALASMRLPGVLLSEMTFTL